MTFAAGLRAILRQDPDVIMVGEIRDSETAQIAVPGQPHRPPGAVDGPHQRRRRRGRSLAGTWASNRFLLASTLRLIIAQRLVRRLCEHCRAPEPADPSAAALAGIALGQIHYRAVGCAHCGHTGYQGRLGLYEAIRVDDRLRRLIGQNASEQEITAAGLGATLGEEARRYILDGLTTVEEALRITGAGARDGDV